MSQLEPAELPVAATVDYAIDVLLNLELRPFYDVVDRDIRANDRGNNDDETPLDPLYSKALRASEVCERWYQALVRMKKSTEMTISAKGMDDKTTRHNLMTRGLTVRAANERVKHLKWRAGAVRFLTGVEERLSEANYCRRLQYGTMIPSQITLERDRLSEYTRVLVQAIRAHRDEFLSTQAEVGPFGRQLPKLEPSAADLKLWDVLGSTTEPE